MANDKVKRVADAIASGCYDEIVEKGNLTREAYVEEFGYLFVKAAENAIAELETA